MSASAGRSIGRRRERASNYGRALIDGELLPLLKPRSNRPCLAEFLASEHRITDRDGELITGPVEDLSE